MTFEEFLKELLELDKAPAHDTVRLAADVTTLALGDTVLETAELPAGRYKVCLGMRAVCDEGYVAFGLSDEVGVEYTDIKDAPCKVYTQDNVATDATPMTTGCYIVDLPVAGKFAAKLTAVQNFTKLTADTCFLTAVRLGKIPA